MNSPEIKPYKNEEGSKKEQVFLDSEGRLVVAFASKPVDGEANGDATNRLRLALPGSAWLG